MIKKLVKHGNSSALVIDKSILKLLNIKGDTSVKLEIKKGSLVVTPVAASLRKNKNDLDKNIDEIIDKYSEALKKLKES